MNMLAICIQRTLQCTTALATMAGASLFGSEVIHWNRLSVETTARVMPDDPLTESRILAIVHLAMHDAANHVKPRFQTYAPASPEPGEASVDAAVASAAYVALSGLLPNEAQALEREFNGRIRSLPESTATVRGVALGKAAAARLLELRKADGEGNHIETKPGTKPGQHRPTAPDFTPALMGHWGRLPPFALASSHQFRPSAPPVPDSAQALADIDEVRAVGGANSERRTFEQSEVACFWYEHSTRGWNRIAREIAASRVPDLWEQARMLALVNVAMADGFIGGFEAKYHYYYWRPSTAIRAKGDSEWLSFLPTPPVPDYPSTHTVLGAAAATAMARCLGTDFVSFSMTSGAPYPNITRRFWSLSQAAQENGASRILAGLHFNRAVQAGYRQGVEIGAWAAGNVLRPLELDTRLQVTAGD